MTGKLYVIGVGPGDPELLTLKAVRILKDIQCICVPKGRDEGSSLALSIVQKALNLEGKEIIEAHFPMRKTGGQKPEVRSQTTDKDSPQNKGTVPDLRTQPTVSPLTKGELKGVVESGLSPTTDKELDIKWNKTVEAILNRLNKGIDMAFITIGDPTIYSTFFYLYDKLLDLNPELNIEIVPGVSSINTAAARAGLCLSLADEKIAILPANYMNDIKETLARFDTVVLMKVNKVFDGVMSILRERGLIDNAVYVCRAGMEDEKIFKNIRDIKESDLNYFSLVIIKK